MVSRKTDFLQAIDWVSEKCIARYVAWRFPPIHYGLAERDSFRRADARRLGGPDKPGHDSWACYSAATFSASAKVTDTNWLTPRSAMVTPNSRFIRDMVRAWWVITRKRVPDIWVI